MNDVLIVFSPKEVKDDRKRFLISINQLHKYIGDNANKAITAIKNQETNKTTLKFRKYGKIEIYLK